MRALTETEQDFLAANAERVNYFALRMAEKGWSPDDVVIVLVDVDEPGGFGRALADDLMPGHDWQEIRDRGEIPVARGLCHRSGIQALLDSITKCQEAAAALRALSGKCAIVAVVDCTVLVFERLDPQPEVATNTLH